MNMRKQTKRQMKKAAKATAANPLAWLSDAGVRSGHAYSFALIHAGLSMITWLGSRGGDDAKPRGSWSLYFGTCAATLMALGVGLKHEE